MGEVPVTGLCSHYDLLPFYAGIAQSVERVTCNLEVGGATPSASFC